jgi:argininosuccinate synthase
MLRWLKDKYQCEIVCYCADVARVRRWMASTKRQRRRARRKLYIEDLRDEFVRDYVWTSVKANAIYEGVYLMGTSLARPVIAKRQIEIAQKRTLTQSRTAPQAKETTRCGLS